MVKPCDIPCLVSLSTSLTYLFSHINFSALSLHLSFHVLFFLSFPFRPLQNSLCLIPSNFCQFSLLPTHCLLLPSPSKTICFHHNHSFPVTHSSFIHTWTELCKHLSFHNFPIQPFSPTRSPHPHPKSVVFCPTHALLGRHHKPLRNVANCSQ